MGFILIQKSNNEIIDVRDDDDFGACNKSDSFIVKEVPETKKEIYTEITKKQPVINLGNELLDKKEYAKYITAIKDIDAVTLNELIESKDKTAEVSP